MDIIKNILDNRIEYTLDGNLHREDGPAVEYNNGIKYWYLNGNLHREDGPAMEYPNDYSAWYDNGILHRDNGPAIEYPGGGKEWYFKGNQISEESLQEILDELAQEKETEEDNLRKQN